MKIITDKDFTLKVKLMYNNVPLLIQDVDTLSLSLYTTNPDVSINYTLSDVDASGNLFVDHDNVLDLRNGILYYKYAGTTDGHDFGGIWQTEFYIQNTQEYHSSTCATAVSELVNDVPYAPKRWVEKNFLKKDSSIAGYATTEYVDSEIARVEDEITEVKTNAYTSISKVEEYLYNVEYDYLDYDYAKEWFESKAPDMGACSALRAGNFIGRNYDWYDNYDAVFNVRTTNNMQGRNAVIGTAGSLSALSNEIVDSMVYMDEFKVLPFYLQDGINEHGLFAEMNVVPTTENPNFPTIPTVEKRDSICVIMLVRYILDNFDTVDNAVEYLQNYVEIYTTQSLQEKNYEVHIMLADPDETVVIEFIDGEIVVINSDKSTNFHLWNTAFLPDGGVYTMADAAEGNYPSSLGIENYGSGLERWNILNAANVTDIEGMKAAMNSVLYSKTYTLSDNIWYSEFVGGDINVDTPSTDASLNERVLEYKELYENRTKDNPQTWFTSHMSIYDLDEKTITTRVQENAAEHVFKFNPVAGDVTKEYVDGEIARVESEIPNDYLPLSGGEMTGQITTNKGCGWASGRDYAPIKNTFTYDASVGSRISPLVSGKTNHGDWTVATYPTARLNREELTFAYTTDEQHDEQDINNVKVTLRPIAGTIALTDEIPDVSAFVTKEYVDGEITRVEEEIPSTEDFATKEELEDVEQAASNAINDLQESKITGMFSGMSIWVGTQDDYDALTDYDPLCVYLIKEDEE